MLDTVPLAVLFRVAHSLTPHELSVLPCISHHFLLHEQGGFWRCVFLEHFALPSDRIAPNNVENATEQHWRSLYVRRSTLRIRYAAQCDGAFVQLSRSVRERDAHWADYPSPAGGVTLKTALAPSKNATPQMQKIFRESICLKAVGRVMAPREFVARALINAQDRRVWYCTTRVRMDAFSV
jgi:hypothetical protein